jgi:PilZ domain
MSPSGPKSQDGRDERRRQRVLVDLSARLGGRPERPARVADLSLAGCLVRTEAGLDAGAVVDLSIELPDGPLRTKARVAEASIDGDSLPGPSPRVLAGLQFLALAAADELRLRVFLDAEAKRRRGAHPPPA